MFLSQEIIRRQILQTISDHENKITSRDIEKKMVQEMAVGRREFQSALKALIAEGELAYTYIYGCTFVEKSFNRPVRVGSRVILTPPEHHPVLNGSDIAVMLRPGASFGCGQHPTTRLAIQGIEVAMEMLHIDNIDIQKNNFAAISVENGRKRPIPSLLPCEMNFLNVYSKLSTVLDIGTGSGVLAISALKLGIHQAVGTDTDPCAIAEAGENARINGLSDRFTIIDTPAEEINGQFDLIAANLRYPTLVKLCSYIASHLPENSAAILSGIREDEVEKLKNHYAETNLVCRWEKSENRWAGLVLIKQAPARNL